MIYIALGSLLLCAPVVVLIWFAHNDADRWEEERAIHFGPEPIDDAEHRTLDRVRLQVVGGANG